MKQDSRKLLVQLCGPTAVGKSAVAMALAKKWNTAILSADSRQVYKEMNIGTAKPSPEDREQVPHYFVDQFPLEANISAADFERLGNQYLDEIFSKKDRAIVCGGTGLYLRALSEGLDPMPPIPDSIRLDLEVLYQQSGREGLREALAREDPLFLEKGESWNTARMIRALAVYRASGRSILDWQSQQKASRPYQLVKIGLELPRELLYERIHARIDQMVDRGLIEEARRLWPRQSLKSLQTVGYQELFLHFDGKISLEQALDLLRRNTRRYAKRQMTWFRKDPQIQWFSADDPQRVSRIEDWVNRYAPQ